MSKKTSNTNRVLRSSSGSEAPILSSSKCEKSMTITVADLHEALDQLRFTLREEIRKDFQEELRELRTTIQNQQVTIQTMKTTIIEQALCIERYEKERRANCAIIYGIPEATDSTENLNDKIIDILQKTEVYFNSSEVFPVRIGKKGKNPRPVKITLKSEATKKEVVAKAREKFPKKPELKSIFINYDQSPLTRKENLRLREKMKSLRVEHPQKEIKISNGLLLMDGLVVDKFDLRTQVFQ